MPMADTSPASPLDEEEHISLCETLDRVLNKGVVISGEAIISVADIDLIYLGLYVVLASVDTLQSVAAPTAAPERQSRG